MHPTTMTMIVCSAMTFGAAGLIRPSLTGRRSFQTDPWQQTARTSASSVEPLLSVGPSGTKSNRARNDKRSSDTYLPGRALLRRYSLALENLE